MSTEPLKSYKRTDVSQNTDSCVYGIREMQPRGVLIHTTSGAASLTWLQGESCKAGKPAGADALIARSGEQFLITNPAHFAYHAGVSTLTLDRTYHGDEVSQLLLGVELECTDAEQPTWEQYDSLGDLICHYALHFGWTWPYIGYGHYGVARPLGRRSDPVSFDWMALNGRLYVRTKQARIPGLD